MMAAEQVSYFWDNVPQELKALPQWVVWRLVQRPGSDKPTKVPFMITGDPASSKDPATWSSFEDAVACYQAGGFNGVGFVFSESDPYVGIDTDDAETTAQVIPLLSGTYTEKSFSGRGYHAICRGALSGMGINAGGFEMYDRGRYFAFTGRMVKEHGPLITDQQPVIDQLEAKYRTQTGEALSHGLETFDDSPENQQRGREFLAARKPAVEGDSGDLWTFKTAAWLRDIGLSPRTTFDLMAEPDGWNDSCLPPWDLDDLEHKVASAYRNSQNAPGAKHVSKQMEQWFGGLQGQVVQASLVHQTQAQTYESLDLDQMADISGILNNPPPKLVQAIENILPANLVSAIVGPPGNGKSAMMIQAAVAMGTGTQLFGHPEWTPDRKRKVLVLDAEDDRDEFHRRLASYVDHNPFMQDHIADIYQNVKYWYPGGTDIRLTDREGNHTPLVGWLCEQLKRLDYDHVILGPAVNMLGGEETNEGMAALTSAWLRISAEAGVGVTGVHHTTKQSTLNADRTQTAARGGGSFTGSVRAQLHIQNMSQDEATSLSVDDPSRWVGLSMVKANGMSLWGPVWLQRHENSAVMHWPEQQPVNKNAEEQEQKLEDRLKQVSSLAQDLLVNIYREDTPIRRIIDEYAGAENPFQLGRDALRSTLIQACHAGLLHHDVRIGKKSHKEEYWLLAQRQPMRSPLPALDFLQ